jgi:hypothetical protein
MVNLLYLLQKNKLIQPINFTYNYFLGNNGTLFLNLKDPYSNTIE